MAALYDEQQVSGDQLGSESTTSTTWVDLAGASITLSLSTPRRVLVGVLAVGYVNSTGEQCFTINIDGTDIGGTGGLVCANDGAANAVHSYGFTYMTDELTAASHTIKVRHRVTSGTGFVYNGTGFTYSIWTKELL